MMNAKVIGAGALLLALPVVLVSRWIGAAEARLVEASTVAAPQVAIAAEANETYCTPELKQILRRVLQSCGLVEGGGGRGCQPVEAKSIATMSDKDFNALFTPMSGRGGIIQFDQAGAMLDADDIALVDKMFADRRGASYFLVVSRASPEGAVHVNRELSRQRAETVLSHLETAFQDPDLDKQVGLLWLGEEYAQLDPSFCQWPRSGTAGGCDPNELNRSSFVAWIDCRL